MADEYLWEKSDPVDPEVVALERRLGVLRQRGPLFAPVRAGPSRPVIASGRPRAPVVSIAFATAIATAALIALWVRGEVPRESEPPAIAVTGPPPPTPAALPETLTAQQIRDAIAPVKPDVKACGPQHGFALGTRIKMDLSIAGATGRISRASATGTHAGTPLEACIVAALQRARFPRFAKAQMGVQFPFTL